MRGIQNFLGVLKNRGGKAFRGPVTEGCAAYPMNVCKFSNGEWKELDHIIKREMRSSNILGNQGRDEWLYLKREDGGRGISL